MEKKYQLALDAMQNAYAVYSGFRVGACLVLKNGEYIIGANVENSSYGLCNCAERSALFAAYSKGYRKDDILELVVATDTVTPSSPCGACRQVICELMNQEALVTLINPKLINTYSIKVSELLPYQFTGDCLNDENKL